MIKYFIVSKDINSPEFINSTSELIDRGGIFVINPEEADVILVDQSFVGRVIQINKDKLPVRYINWKNLLYNEFFH